MIQEKLLILSLNSRDLLLSRSLCRDLHKKLEGISRVGGCSRKKFSTSRGLCSIRKFLRTIKSLNSIKKDLFLIKKDLKAFRGLSIRKPLRLFRGLLLKGILSRISLGFRVVTPILKLVARGRLARVVGVSLQMWVLLKKLMGGEMRERLDRRCR